MNDMKLAVINRGISGSGKSTFIEKLKEFAEGNDFSISVHSTDDKFMVDGKYMFDVEKLGGYHGENFHDFCNSINSDTNIVVCDNTNISSWEYKNYAKVAKENGYRVIAVIYMPDTVDNHVSRNTHGVPRDIIEKKRKKFLNCLPVHASVDNVVVIQSDDEQPFDARLEDAKANVLKCYKNEFPTVYSALDHYTAQQGWDDDSKLGICLSYIADMCDKEEFTEYIKAQADEENNY